MFELDREIGAMELEQKVDASDRPSGRLQISVDEHLEAEGFVFSGVLANNDFSEEIKIFLKQLEDGDIEDFRLVPCYLARENGKYSGKKDAYSVYVKYKKN